MKEEEKIAITKYDLYYESRMAIDLRLDKIESKMDMQFHWILGTILGLIGLMITVFGGIILHMAKLI